MIKNRRLVLVWCFWMAGVAGGSVAGNRWTEIKRVLALSESTKIMPTDTAFNATGYDDNGGLVMVEGTEIKLTKNSSWWSTDWKFKKQITVKNLGSSSVATNMTAQVATDLATLGLGTTKLQSDLDDLRVIYSVGNTHTEVSRTVSQAVGQTNVATISFPLQAGIGVTASDSSYYLYYGNIGATGVGNSAGYNIGSATATFVAPFLGSTGAVVAGGTANPTTATGAIRFSGQKSALSFDGSNDTVNVTSPVSLRPTGSLTIEAWVNGKNLQNGQKIVQIENPEVYSGDGNGYYLRYNAGSAQCLIGKTGGYVSATKALSGGSFHHVACVYDGNNLKVYVDGVGGDASGYTGAINYNNTGGLFVGNYNGGSFWNGVIDELRISDAARYTSDFSPQAAPFAADSNTKLLFHFDENGDSSWTSGRVYDASGNGNHGTISGAKYVGGLVGVDSSSSDSGYLSVQSYAGHGGVMLEEGTTNFVPNPSFEHSTYNLGWSLPYFNFGTGVTTFTAAMAKRNSAGPFAAGVVVQGVGGSSTIGDEISFSNGTALHCNDPFGSGSFWCFEPNFDIEQGSIVFWLTPEYGSVDLDVGTRTIFTPVTSSWQDRYRVAYDYQNDRFVVSFGASSTYLSYTLVAGNTYLVVVRFDDKNILNGSNGVNITVNDNESAWGTYGNQNMIMSTSYLKGDGAGFLMEGLTIYRRPLWDGEYGINVGNGDEINQIYNAGAGRDPTLVTGSWDVVFALPTNASVGGIGTTGQAWSHPHASNALYVGTTKTGGFMMGSSYTADGWADLSAAGAPVFGAGSSASGVATTMVTWGHTVGSGDNRFLVVSVNYYDAMSRSVSSVTYNGDALTKIGTMSQSGIYSDLWYMVAPDTGTNNVVVTMSATADVVLTGAANFSGVNQTSPVGVGISAKGISGTEYAINVGTSANSVIYGTVMSYGGASAAALTMDVGQTEVYDQEIDDGSWYTGAASWKGAGEGTTAFGYDSSKSSIWTLMGVAINSAGGVSTTVENQASGDKIFAGGYKWTSTTANQGIGYTLSGLTAGQNYVVRALANSDGTSIPKIQIWDKTNNAEITQMTGTVGSGRTAPDTFVFTFELPTTARHNINDSDGIFDWVDANCTSIEVRLLNTQTSGTVYWHQVEVLQNLVDNPSMVWVGTTIPGWSLYNSAGTMSESSSCNSGNCIDYLYSGSYIWNGIQGSASSPAFGFFAEGFWYDDSYNQPHNYDHTDAYPHYTSTMTSIYADSVLVGQVMRRSSGNTVHCRQSGTSAHNVVDDYFVYQLSSVSLTVTPASQVNSVETSGLRVDGLDTLTQPITDWLTTAGTAKFIFTPRHNFDIGASFGSTAPVIVTLDGGTSNTVKLYKTGTTLNLQGIFNGTTVNAGWTNPTLNAGTSYPMEIAYSVGVGNTGALTLKVGGSLVASGTGVVGFSTVPTTAYFGSDLAGANQYDGTITNFVSLAATENTTALYYKFGSKSVRLVNSGGAGDEYAVSLNVGATATHTLSAYVYDGTTGNAGGTVDGTVAVLSVGNTNINTTYTDTGGGWWRLSGTVVGVIDTRPYGVQVRANKTVYVDGFQLERDTSGNGYRSQNRSYTTSYIDGSLGIGFTWLGEANNSVSSRTGGAGAVLAYPISGNISASAGTVSLWVKRLYADANDKGWGYTAGYFSTHSSGEGSGSINIDATSTAIRPCGWWGTTTSSTVGRWYNVVVTWDAVANSRKCYVNNSKIVDTTGGSINIQTLKIGQASNWGAVYPSDGIISDLRIYNAALSADEVGQLYWSGLMSHEAGSEAVDRYVSGGTYISPVMDLSANGAWGAVPVVFTDTALAVGGSASYYTRTSADNSAWGEWMAAVGTSIASDPRRYIQWKVDLAAKSDQSETPVVSGMVVSYVEDSNAPTNPEASTVAAYSAGVGTTALTSGEWYNYASPSFVWGTGVDTVAEGQSASGIDSYLVLLTTDVGATPSSNTGNACYLEAEAESRQFRVGSSPAGCSVSNGIYYLRMQTKDNSGNISAPMTMFTYKYDGSSPSAPTSVSSTTVGYSATNKYTFYWPVASDVGPAGLRGYEYKTGASDGTFSEWQFTTSTTIADVEAYQEGQNFFYVRTVDNAGNYSATTSNLGVAPFYYNASAPSAPLNVTVEPITSSTSPSASNVFDVSWDKPESYSGEIAKYYYCVNCTPGAGNMTETSSAETVDRRLENVALATQQGKNTFYIVAEDNNVNVTTGYGNRNFEAYAAVDFWAATVAPETPSNLTITDASDRAASKWRLTLAWDVGSTANGATPDHYEIYRSTDNSTFSVIGTVSATAYTDAGLTQSTTYYYKIKAVDNAGSKSLFTSTVNKSPEGRYTSPPSAGGVPTATSGSTTATIKWSTSRSSYGSVEYGETSSYGSAASGASATANHSIKLTGLAPGKTYHYRVLSLDDSALVGYDRTTAYSTDYTFTTLSNPEITDIAVEEVGLDSATISWKTRTMATADLDYGLTTEYGMSKTLSTTEAENSHTVRLTKLDHSSTYHFRIRGKTVDGDNIVSQDQTFSTITYPKINAYVLKTDQQAGGVTVQAVWTTNVMASSVLEYQVMEIDREEFDKMNFDFEPTADNLSKLSQTVLNRVPVISKGDKQQESKSALATTHSMKIGNLKDGSIYAMTLRGRDKYGNEAVSDPIRYVTGKDTRPPVISGLVVETQVSGSGSNASCSIIVSWETDEPATTQVVYGPGTGSEYNLSTPEEKGLIRRHVVVIRDLQTNTSYHLKVKSADESENLVQSQDLIAVTPATQESALDVVLSNLEDVFGFLKI